MSLPPSDRSPPSSKARSAPDRPVKRMKPWAIALAIAAASAAPAIAGAQVQSGWFCGGLETGYGPFDYRTTPKDKRDVVERHHFTPKVVALAGGQSSSQIGADIAYTLHAFPNHPVALDAMARLGRKEGKAHVRGARYTVECYFERAIRFAPDDPQVRVLYAHFLVGAKRLEDATRQLDAADRSKPTSPYIQYNLGLGYADVGNYDKSLAYAHRAYSAGIDLPGLRERLQRAGKWKNPAK